MKFKSFALILVCAVTAGATLVAQGRLDGGSDPRSPATAPGDASVVGRVINPATDTPVRDAEVVAQDNNGRRLTSRTDDTGSYRLDRLAPGEWRITASKGGYTTWQYGQRRPFQTPPPIRLARGERFIANIPLTRGGAITGRVSDEFGEAVAGLQVRAYRTRMQQGSRRLQAVAAADLTDDTGSFRIYGLPPGDYYLGASLRVAPVDSVVETTYAPTYFPGTGDLAEAQRIRLGLGSEATASFPLLPFRRVRVSGLVLNSAGAPADAFLNLESDATEFGVPLGVGGVTRSDGTFTLADVPPGRYRLSATLRGDGPDESGSVSVTVYGDDLTGTTLVTGRPATLRGTFVADAGVTRRLPNDLEVVAYSARAGGTVLGSGSGTTFEIDALSEPFRLAVPELPDGWAIKDILVNGVNAVDNDVTPTPGQQAEARIFLTDRASTVSGSVTGTDATRVVSVVVFPEDSTRWGARSRYVRVVRADAQGYFRISGLPPGDRYLALATDDIEEGEHQDPEFLTAMQPLAAPFSLGEGEQRTVDVRLVER